MVTIRSNTKELLAKLKQVGTAVKARNKKAMNATCEITVTDGKATFAVPGAIFTLDCKTQSTCKATVSFLHFYDIIKTHKEKETEIVISESEMKIGPVTVSVRTTFFETDRILRTIHLPINYTNADLLRLGKDDHFTTEEINFNKLTFPIYEAEKNLQNDLKAAYKRLKDYGVTYEELAELAERKIFS